MSASICGSCAFSLVLFLVWLFSPILICFCFNLFYFYSLGACFLTRDRKSVDLDGKGGGEE